MMQLDPLDIRTEVQIEIDATRQAFLQLRAAVLKSVGVTVADPNLRGSGAQGDMRGRELRELDNLFAAHTGVVLLEKNAPNYTGPLYEWRSSPDEVRVRAVRALIRLRGRQQAGVQVSTSFVVRNYFSSIWPSDLEWPDHIPRPQPKSPSEVSHDDT